MKYAFNTLITIICCTLLSACLIADDDNGQWQKSYIDKALIGKWIEDKYSSRLASLSDHVELADSGKDYLYIKGGEFNDAQIRTFKIGGTTFLIMKQARKNSAPKFYITGYEVTADHITIYAGKFNDKSLIKKFSLPQNNDPNATALIVPKLDDEKLKMLDYTYSNKNYVTMFTTLRRVK